MSSRSDESSSARVTSPIDPLEWARPFWALHGLGEQQDEFFTMGSLFRFHRMVADQVEGALRAHKLNITDYMLLMTLRLSDNGTRLISQLARILLVHATTATLATDRLEKRGLIVRSPHPTDRRATLVSITAAGKRISSEATDSVRQVDFGLCGSSAADRADFAEILARMRMRGGDTNVISKVRPTHDA
ncbi:MarR family transcriptional regulator [Pseudofrankia sp. BMG5.36]|nr:MarR family transcriptional regulator [Pseudofrankia sp. BMG5.36]